MELLDYEKKHLEILNEIAGECSLFLKREDFLPLNKDIKEIALFGNGVRHTVKGGTGSGNVDIHFFDTIYDVFKNAGIKITTDKWLDEYDALIPEHKKAFIKKVKQEAKVKGACDAVSYSVGKNMPEFEHNIEYYPEGDTALYVISRNCGEGQDRELIKGDFYLTDTEIKTILELDKRYKHFLLVLNVNSVIDISPVISVRNIFLLSQLGSLTSKALFDIVFGDKNPSGKLTTTWDKIENYPHYEEFGKLDDSYYMDSLYVGYKHFDTFNKKPLFEFGFGKGYSEFKIEYQKIKNRGSLFEVKAKVTNIGDYSGKEVVQLYLRKPSDDIDNPLQHLVAYTKTRLLKPNDTQIVTLVFDMKDFPTFDSKNDAYIIQKGINLLALGNSSRNLEVIASIEIDKLITLMKVKHLDVKLPFEEDKNPQKTNYKKLENNIILTAKDFSEDKVVYKQYEVEIPRILTRFSDEELMRLSCGDIKTGIQSAIGESCSTVLGAAGETYLHARLFDKNLSMADGPAGIRITKEYLKTRKRRYKMSTDPIYVEIANYIPSIAKPLILGNPNIKKKGEVIRNYATSIPIGAAIAQSFNNIMASKCGDIIREEMELFNVDIWLAPAMNIIKHVLCGRNFEYFSEDPFLTATMAISLITSIERNPNKGVVIKHFACNNQETNRTANNSILSMRALREVYLFAFAMAVKHTHPFGVMASYNLINGIHASENYYLLNDILRCEWGFEGVVLTDWIATGQRYYKKNKYPYAHAYKNILGGSNLNMPGSNKDLRDMFDAMDARKLTRKDLLRNAAIVMENINRRKKDANK